MPSAPGLSYQEAFPTSANETGGDAAGQWVLDPGFYGATSGTPTDWIESDGTWTTVRPWTTFRVFRDGVVDNPLLRPHIKATQLEIEVTVMSVGGTFGSQAYVELIDDTERGRTWVPDTGTGTIHRFDRVVYTSASIPVTGSWNTVVLTLNSELIRGWEGTAPNGGIRNFGDLGVRVYAPGSPSAPGTTKYRIGRIRPLLEHPEPFFGIPAQWGVRGPNQTATGGWASVYYAGVANNPPLEGKEYYVSTVDGSLLNSSTVAIDAANRAGDLRSPESVPFGQPTIIDIEPLGVGPSAPHLTKFTATAPSSGNFSANFVVWRSAANLPRKIDKLMVRSVDRSNNGRAEFSLTNPMNFQPNSGIGYIGMGHVSLAGCRLFRVGNSRCISTDGVWDDEMCLGEYDLHFTGLNNQGGAGGPECDKYNRLGSHAIDAIDCKFGSCIEHCIYKGGTQSTPDGQQNPDQVLRCENTGSIKFYPLHPSPDLTFEWGRRGRGIPQIVVRTNLCSGGGFAPPAWSKILVEDVTARNGTDNPSPCTLPGVQGEIVIRRYKVLNIDTAKGGAIAILSDTLTGNEANQSKGHHNSLGQFDGPDKAITCNATVPVPEDYPHTGTFYFNGSVVVEDFYSTTTPDGSAIRTCGCKSVIIRRGDFTDNAELPAFRDCEMNTSGSWGNSGYGTSLSVRLEGMGPTPATYKGWRSKTGNPAGNVAFGAKDNVHHGGGSNAHLLTNAEVNALAGPNNWPPWPQAFADTVSGNATHSTNPGQWLYRVSTVFPGMRRPTSYGTNHYSIIFPGINRFLGTTLKFTPSAPTDSTPTVHLTANSFDIEYHMGSGNLPADMVANPFRIEIQPKRGEMSMQALMDPFGITFEDKRGHISFEGGPTSIEVSMDPFFIELEMKRLDIIFSPQMTGDPFELQFIGKRGHISIEGQGGELDLTMDPFRVEWSPGLLDILFAPYLFGDSFDLTMSMGSMPIGGMLVTDDPFLIGFDPGLIQLSGFSSAVSGGWANASSKVRTDFANLVLPSHPIKVQYDNMTVAISDEKWCRLNVRHESTRRLYQSSAAGGMIERRGTATAQLFAPIVDGDGELLEIADFIESAFREITLAGVTYHVPATDRIGRTPNGKWWQVNVRIPFGFVMEV